jgi:hypothetical protein
VAAAVEAELANHRGMGPLKYFDDLAIGAAAGLDAGDADEDAVAVHGFAGGFGWKEDVALDAFERLFGDKEAVAIAMHVEAADGEFARACGDHVVSGAQLDEVAAGRETGERGFETFAARAFGAHFADELLEVGAGVR